MLCLAVERAIMPPPASIAVPMGIGVTVARLTLNQLVKVRILDPQLSPVKGHLKAD